MMTSEFHVFYDEQKVGDLFEIETGTIGFQYDPKWMTSGFEISHALPFRERRFEREANIFFANLLPEGDVRAAVASRLGISVENDFSLLTALGGECAGAFTVGREPRKIEANYEKVSGKDLEARITRGETLLSSLQDEDEEIHFSLAGAQDKLAVFIDSGDIYLPQGNSPSTYILKPPSKRFKHVPDSECLMSHLARALGLDVAPAEIIELGQLRACLIKRYDRVSLKGQTRRLHQEDFCQALGFSHKAKYEKDKGPTFALVYKGTEEFSGNLPDDLERVIKWLIFNVVIGNCDGHAKNLSLLRSDAGDWALSPHYDFISTRVYPRVSTRLAMAVGGSRDSGTITGTHWKTLAKEIKFGASLLQKFVRELAEAAPEKFADVAAEFKKTYGPSPVIPPIQKVIHEQSRRLLTQLEK